MDIYCGICSEPWDNDCLHDMPEGSPYKTPYDTVKNRNPGYEQASRLFRQYGCGFFAHAQNGAVLEPCKRAKSPDAGAIQAIYDVNGGDMDGAAADFEDARAMGLL